MLDLPFRWYFFDIFTYLIGNRKISLILNLLFYLDLLKSLLHYLFDSITSIYFQSIFSPLHIYSYPLVCTFSSLLPSFFVPVKVLNYNEITLLILLSVSFWSYLFFRPLYLSLTKLSQKKGFSHSHLVRVRRDREWDTIRKIMVYSRDRGTIIRLNNYIKE